MWVQSVKRTETSKGLHNAKFDDDDEEEDSDKETQHGPQTAMCPF